MAFYDEQLQKSQKQVAEMEKKADEKQNSVNNKIKLLIEKA